MAVAIALILAVLAVQHRLKCDHEIDVATSKRMQQCEEYLHQEMIGLLREIERSRSLAVSTPLPVQGLPDTCKELPGAGHHEQLPARHSSIHVVLEGRCSREQLLGDILCFLHHPDDKLWRDQSLYLLCTLCTCSYLGLEKITRWVQHLVRSAWLLLPQSHHCQLMVLPSSWSCRFQLTSTSKMNIFTEMIFAVQQGSSGTYLNLE
ncbi:inositol 1,4,5-trisphosphate receptor-interacting protein-like 1 [Harpia harpyja]|uniref:inositol 1,4,5-trisphosphate receptor-interacting protein-like 1 n=1 Tax=Harpia harpyja TaxID=202280 RepID=UPI0022B18EBE|nr:inositol 1,4,5-trisphosphate receptor-interacting protein-like 1 [Harpia harpyja]